MQESAPILSDASACLALLGVPKKFIVHANRQKLIIRSALKIVLKILMGTQKVPKNIKHFSMFLWIKFLGIKIQVVWIPEH